MLTGYPSRQIHWWSCLPQSDPAFEQQVEKEYYFAIPRRLIPHQRFTRFKSSLLEHIWVPFAATHLRRVIRQVKPEQIWAVLGGWAVPALARSSPVLGRCHASLWDYPDIASRRSIFGVRRVNRMTEQALKLFQMASTRDVVCRPMAEDITSRTGVKPDLILHSGIEPKQLLALRTQEPEVNSEIRIAYAGTVIEREAFATVAKGLDRARQAMGKPVKLLLFGAHSYRDEPWFDPAWMTERHGLADPQFFAELRQCSWGLVVMGLSEANAEYNRFSFPNKVGTYLASGLPILAFGHPTSSIAQLMNDHPAGAHSAVSTPEGISEFLRHTLAEPDPKRRYGLQILRCAETEFDAEAMRSQLWRCLGVK